MSIALRTRQHLSQYHSLFAQFLPRQLHRHACPTVCVLIHASVHVHLPSDDLRSDHGVFDYNWGPHLPPQYGDGGGHATLGAMSHPMGCWAMHDKIDGRVC